LHNQRQILNLAQGGFGIGTPPHGVGFREAIKADRPVVQFYDLDLDLLQRNATQAGVNLYDRAGDMKNEYDKAKRVVNSGTAGVKRAVEVNEQLKAMGLDTPEKVRAYFEQQQIIPLRIE
jgi:hypothetical protein